MNSSLEGFLAEHDGFASVMSAYGAAYADGIAHDQEVRAQDKQELLADLSRIEQTHSGHLADIDAHAAAQLDRLGNIDASVGMAESQVSQRNLERALRRRHGRRATSGSAQGTQSGDFEPDSPAGNGTPTMPSRVPVIRHGGMDVHERAVDTLGAIHDITGSKLPKFLTTFADYVELPSRRRKYDRIAEAHGRLNDAILGQLGTIDEQSQSGKAAADAEALAMVDRVQAKAEELDARRSAEASAYFAQLKSLLLDGMESSFSADSIYANATDDLEGYLSGYTDAGDGTGTWKKGLMLGIVNQPATVSDDGTLDSFLSGVLPAGTYGNGTILLPVVLSRHLAKPICLTYFSEHVDGVYVLFSNYATQLMNLYGDETLSVYMVDCTHAGGKYASFNACSDVDEDKRINIVQTKEELKSVLSALHEHVIESNSLYLKDAYPSVEEYNRHAVMKREIKAIFVSALSELGNDDLEVLETLARTGGRCGVLVFVGVSSDEFQASGVITRARATETTNLASLCDRIYMDSAGTLGLGNGRPSLVPPPGISPTKATGIMRSSVTGHGKSVTLALENYLPTGVEVLSGSCKERLDIPVGQTPQGDEYVISFHKDASYMLLGGNPSAGKSSLIHTMILQCITRYRPEDLEIYVADLKDGSEFDAYAMAGVKSVRAVLDDSENDLATSFLQFIRNEISRRLRRFAELEQATSHRIRNIEEFYEMNEQSGRPCENIPRLLLIVDEFQSLYANNRDTGGLTNWILRMGRTVGVAVVFSSQRSQADVATTNSSFGAQTKEYFIYRVMLKLPYSGAKDIMNERCSDTGRENPALRKAQTLRVGQAIVNSNMGSTEEDSQIIQCYYPSSELIDAICAAVVEQQGRRDDSFILGSDKPVKRSRPESDRIMLGESNRFHADDASTDDAFHDDMVVSLDASVGALGVYGVSEAAYASATQACLAALGSAFGDVGVSVLGRGRVASTVASAVADASVTDSVGDFVTSISELRSGGRHVLAVIAEPYLWKELQSDALGRNGANVEDVLGMIGADDAFVLLCAPDIRKMKNDVGWHDDAVPARVLTVGNPALLRQMVSTDVADRISDGSFNVARADVIKAYYYNRETGKFGRMRMFPVESDSATYMPSVIDVLSGNESVAVPPAPGPDDRRDGDGTPGDGWAGLTGN